MPAALGGAVARRVPALRTGSSATRAQMQSLTHALRMHPVSLVQASFDVEGLVQALVESAGDPSPAIRVYREAAAVSSPIRDGNTCPAHSIIVRGKT